MISESDLEMSDTVKSQPKLKSNTALPDSDTVLEDSVSAQNQIKV